MNNKGFTLIEFLIIIAIVGVLAAIVIPAFMGKTHKGKDYTINQVSEKRVTRYESVDKVEYQLTPDGIECYVLYGKDGLIKGSNCKF